MASLISRPGGHFWIQFCDPNGKRPTIRLGKTTRSEAAEFKLRVERILDAKRLVRPVDPVTAKWIDQLTSRMRARLAAAGLADPRPIVGTLKELVAAFEASRDVEPSTLRHIKQAGASLIAFFGEGKDVAQITEDDAARFRAWLRKRGRAGDKPGSMAPATVSRRVGRVRQAFKYAVDRGWLARNPFRRETRQNEANRDRDFLVTLDLFTAIAGKVACRQFRGILALARFGGLRCPSEILPLTWGQVDWERRLIVVEAPKTKRYAGRGRRTVPLFPEIHKALAELYQATPEGESLLFPRYAGLTGTGLTKHLKTACRRAGVTLWAKPWQNMRSTRESELLAVFPIPCVTAWLGHSPTVALRHYAQILPEQEAAAASFRTVSVTNSRAAKAAQEKRSKKRSSLCAHLDHRVKRRERKSPKIT
ncbi:MAG: site-specific integrase [Pirellulales bacterium]|nr:site-specific integrase [Pirellulales bacterium]